MNELRVSALGGALDVAVQVATRMERDGIGVSAEPKQGPEMGNPWGTHGEPQAIKCYLVIDKPWLLENMLSKTHRWTNI